jgi:hypothetical protein
VTGGIIHLKQLPRLLPCHVFSQICEICGFPLSDLRPIAPFGLAIELTLATGTDNLP